MQRKEELSFSGCDMALNADLRYLQGGGGAEREAALTSVEKQLICPICLEMFTKPVVILPCQHNLCRRCANELYQPSLFQARTTMMVNSGRFRCPSCRHEVVLDRHGVYGLQRNLLVENIIDVYKQEVSNVNKASSPVLPPPPSPPPPPEMTCSDHEGEKVNIYCLTCRRPTCSLCKVFGSHQSCNVAPLTHIYEQQKVELNEGLTTLTVFSDKIQALIAELEQSCRNVEEVYKMQKQVVCEKFDRLFSIVDERRKAMMERITSEQEEKMGHAQALLRCYGDAVEANSKLMERAASSMDDPDTAAFVQNSRELITKVTAAASSCPTETLTPGFENMNRYAFNFRRQEEILQNIDFPRVEEDVPEEPEPEETSIHDPDLQPPQETSLQNPDPETGPEPVKEPTQAPISSPVKPVEPVHMSPAAPVQMWDSEEPSVLLLDSGDPHPDPNERVPGHTDIQRQDTEPRTQPDPVKGKNICQQQEGMSTLQCEGGGTEEHQEDRAEDDGTEVEEEARTGPGPAKTLQDVTNTEMMIHQLEPDTDMAPPDQTRVNAHDQTQEHAPGDRHQTPENQVEPPRNQPQTEDQPQPHQKQPESETPSQISEDQCLTSENHIKPNEDQSQTPGDQPELLKQADEPQTCDGQWFPPNNQSQIPALVHMKLTGPDTGEAGEIQEDNSSDEGEEETRSGFEKEPDAFKLRIRNVKGHNKGLKEAAEAEENSGFGEEEETSTEGKGEELGIDSAGFDVKSGLDHLDERCDGDNTDHQVASEEVASEEVASQASILKLTENKAKHEVEESVAGHEGPVKSFMSLQAVTLLFYMLAFLLILQRVWGYIGCFILT